MSYNESLNPNSNYPIMTQSQWDSAPFSQEDPPEREFDVTVTYCISKDTRVTSDDYDVIGDDYFSLNHPIDDYHTAEYSPEEIFAFAKECAENMLAQKDYSIKDKYALQQMIDSCKGWTVDEEDVEQD